MFSSGVPLDRCLQMLARQTEASGLRQAAAELGERILKGSTLSAAMQPSDQFSDVQRQLVRVGENSGALAQVFDRLASDEERRVTLEEKIRLSLMAPMVVAGVCLLVATLLPPFLFRGLLTMFEDAKMTLPWPTRCLIWFSAALRSPWTCLLLVGLGLALWKGWPRVRAALMGVAFQERLLAVPVVGRLLLMTALTRFIHSLETMSLAGVPLIASLQLASESCQCLPLERRMLRAVQQLRDGGDLRASLEAVGLLPGAFIQGLETGMESGQTTRMVSSLYRLYEIELDHSMELLTRAAEPLFLILVGGVVGFTVIATLMPLAQLVQTF